MWNLMAEKREKIHIRTLCHRFLKDICACHMCSKALVQIQVDCDNPLSLEKNNFISLALLHCF